MAGPIYSESFIRTNTQRKLVAYAVPDGQRAVVQTVTCANTDPGDWGVFVRVHGKMLLGVVSRTGSLQTYTNLRTVAYRHETIDVWIDGPGVAVMVSGYVFADPSNSGPPPVTETAFDRLELLPALAALGAGG